VPVFLTGATGFLGRELARRLLESGESVFALVRAREAAEGFARLRESVAAPDWEAPADLAERLIACPGALDRPGLGLAERDRARVLEACDSILHCGANVRFDLSLEESRATNVEGTRAVLELAAERARRGTLARVDHVSTAFVAGGRTDLVREDELTAPAGHRNGYEQSKYEAELLVRDAARELPICVLRPSIIVGESKSGATSSFATIYWPIRIYATGLWRILPGHRDASLDLVPVDFVRDALLAIRARPESVGRTYHLAAGEGATTLGELAELVQRFFPKRKPIRYVNPDLWRRYAVRPLQRITWGSARYVMHVGEAYLPYLASNPRFDTTQARAALAASGIEPPHVRDYVDRLLRFAVESDWGRRKSS
jgi:long-chain acyl-CoA synthetase